MCSGVRDAVGKVSGCAAGWLWGQSPGGWQTPGAVRTESLSQQHKQLEEGDLEDSKKEADSDCKGHHAQVGDSLVVMGTDKTRAVRRGH